MKPIVYTTPTCVYCHALLDWMDGQGIEYEERDSTKLEVYQEVLERFGKELDVVPTTVIGDEVIVGFKRPAILRAMKKYEKTK